jgi:hypothetical protein
MDRGDYYEAKCAIQAELLARVQADRLRARGDELVALAHAHTAAVLGRLALPVADNYACDDNTLTLTPQGGPTHG